jgi:hypothetical protein
VNGVYPSSMPPPELVGQERVPFGRIGASAGSGPLWGTLATQAAWTVRVPKRASLRPCSKAALAEALPGWRSP